MRLTLFLESTILSPAPGAKDTAGVGENNSAGSQRGKPCVVVQNTGKD